MDGVVGKKYLWGGVNTQLLAVLDDENAVVARFEYAGGRMPVARMWGGRSTLRRGPSPIPPTACAGYGCIHTPPGAAGP